MKMPENAFQRGLFLSDLLTFPLVATKNLIIETELTERAVNKKWGLHMVKPPGRI